VLFDLLKNNHWKRPIYFAITVPSSGYYGLEDYFQLEGFAYRLVPIRSKSDDQQSGRVNTKKMYTNLMDTFKWGNINSSKVYIDENISRIGLSIRSNFLRLAESLLDEGKRDSAVKVLDKCLEIVPNEKIKLDYLGILMAQSYYRAAEDQKANQLMELISKRLFHEVKYFGSLQARATSEFPRLQNRDLALFQEMYKITARYDQQEMNKKIELKFKELLKAYKKG